MFLGTTIDNETDFQVDDGADEDSIVFEAGMQADDTIDSDSFFTATVSADENLGVWLDFNNDGDFDPGEHLNGGTSFDVVAAAAAVGYDLCGDTFDSLLSATTI